MTRPTSPMRGRAQGQPLGEPMSVYEVHMGSWRLNSLEDNRSLTYAELADELSSYALDHRLHPHRAAAGDGAPVLRLLGLSGDRLLRPDSRATAHPTTCARSSTACTSRGRGRDPGLGARPTSRATRSRLARFDGTALYEHDDPRRGAHPDWGTLVFNFGRHEVRNFLIANALFWLREYHVDGIRVDAVASMLYLDYSRRAGEWIPNQFGGREDLDAVAFLKELNEVIYADEPGIISAAEESTAWPGVSRPTYLGGLGLRLQVEHGLDARHAGLLRAGPDLPPLPPS